MLDQNRKGPDFTNPRVLTAVAMIAGICALFYAFMHHMHYDSHKYIDSRNPFAHMAFAMCLPFTVICVIGSIVPLLMYITFFDDFKHLNPLLPQHYARIMARAFRALAKNDLKVTEKNL